LKPMEEEAPPPGYRAEVIKATDLFMECINLNKINISVTVSAMFGIIVSAFDMCAVPWEKVEKDFAEVLEQAKLQFGKKNESNS